MSKELTKCDKCKKMHYCDQHHLLPKEIFGDGETINLCKNCHDKIHRYIGYKYTRKENKQPMEFYIEKYLRWMAGLSIIGGIVFLAVRFL